MEIGKAEALVKFEVPISLGDGSKEINNWAKKRGCPFIKVTLHKRGFHRLSPLWTMI